jgi:hypothetical protein
MVGDTEPSLMVATAWLIHSSTKSATGPLSCFRLLAFSWGSAPAAAAAAAPTAPASVASSAGSAVPAAAGPALAAGAGGSLKALPGLDLALGFAALGVPSCCATHGRGVSFGSARGV